MDHASVQVSSFLSNPSEEPESDSSGFKFPGVLNEFVYTRTYARWMEDLRRRETWPETVDRYIDFIFRGRNVPRSLPSQCRKAILSLGVMPSMRALWCAGPPAERDHVCLYNCSSLPMDNLRAFAELLYVLMQGAGVGYSIERTFTSNLPVVAFPTGVTLDYQVQDSTEGWADAVFYVITEAFKGNKVNVDVSKVRPMGARLKTKGGRASGPEPLVKVLDFIQETVGRAAGRQLRPIEVHDICCMEADIVAVGGFRRASLISFSDLEDEDMRHAKDWRKGQFPTIRYMANNSVFYPTRPDEETFWKEWRSLAASGSGERGVYHIPSHIQEQRGGEIRSNPCGEIFLQYTRAVDPWTGAGGGGEFCNLSAVVMRANDTLETLVEKVRLATWLGCVQATYTHFPYLRPAWAEMCNKNRLVGVDITGQRDNPHLSTNEFVMTHLNEVARRTAEEASKALGINCPVAVTCGKPSGNCRPWWSLTTTDHGILTFQDLLQDHPDGSSWADMQQDIRVSRGDTDRKILRTLDNGEMPLIRLNLFYGLSVESTPDHRWFVKYRVGKNRKVIPVQDWVAAKDIQPNDVLDVVLGTYAKTEHSKPSSFVSRAWSMAGNSVTIKQPKELNEDICWLLGYLWGDGCQSTGGFRFRFTDEYACNIRKAQRVLHEQFGVDAAIYRRTGNKAETLEVSSVQLWHWLIRNGVFKYFEEHIDIIPRLVRSSSKDDIIAFMAGLLDSDGWAGLKRKTGHKSRGPKGLGGVTLTTANSNLARHVQDVAWAVGLGFGRSLNNLGKSFQRCREMYLLGLGQQVLPESFEVLRRNSEKLRITEGMEGFINWEWQTASRSYHVGKVRTIQRLSPEPTFDIEVDKDHWYYAGSVKTHNSSQMLDCSSGFHNRYSPYYIRRVRIDAKDPLFSLIRDQGVPVHPENGHEHKPESEVPVWVAEFPVKAPEGCSTRDSETAIEQCNRYLQIMRTWCGQKGHNQSATIYVKDDEWEPLGQWLWENFDNVVGLSFLPYDGGHYRLQPYEEITKEAYESLMVNFPSLDFSVLPYYEKDDMGEGSQTVACMSGACDV